MANTASIKRMTSFLEFARARSWAAKKSVAIIGPLPRPRRSAEAHFDGFTLGRILDAEELRGEEAEGAGEDHIREDLALLVIFGDGVVIGLTREGDLIFGRGELLGELHHILVCFEVGIALGNHHEPRERAAEPRLGL